LACRKHRIDLNAIVDRDPNLFRERLPSFIEQVCDVDYINLFLTSLGFVLFSDLLPAGADQGFSQGSQSPEVISELCDAVREQLEAQDIEKYINSILTAYIVRRPPDLEAGLRVLLRLRGMATLYSLKVNPEGSTPGRARAKCGRGCSQIHYLSGRCGYLVRCCPGNVRFFAGNFDCAARSKGWSL
jgi:IKI3 family